MNTSDWNYLKIKDCAEVIGGGTPSTKKEEYWGEDIPWISPKDLSGNSKKYISKGKKSITELGLRNSSAKLLPSNSLLFSSRAPIGYLVINKNPVATNQGFKSLIVGEGFDTEFFYYLLKRNTEYIKSYASGSTFPEVSGSIVKELEFPIPSYEEQKRISRVLSKLDKKIELNQTMNETLEEIAKTLFKSWFIDFDPVRAKAEGRSTGLSKEISDLFPDSFEDSELGEIPKGWKVKKVGECLEFIYGKGLTKKQRIHGDIPVYGSNGIVGFHNSSNARGPGIVVGRAGNPGTVHWSFKDFYVIDSAFSVNVIDDEMSNFYFFALKKLCLKRLDSGSAIPGLNRNHAYEEKTIIPNLSLLREFNEQSSRFFNKQLLNLEENEVLSQLRDKLLPKLISGELRIPDAEEIPEEASA